MQMIIFCNLVCAYIKIRYVKMTPAQTCPRDDTASGKDISTPFGIQIEFEAKEYSIRFVFEISRIFDSI